MIKYICSNARACTHEDCYHKSHHIACMCLFHTCKELHGTFEYIIGNTQDNTYKCIEIIAVSGR